MATVDRRVAGLVGRALCADEGVGPPGSPPPVDLIGVCDAAGARIAEYARMTPVGALPSPEWIGRGTWIDLNVETVAPVIEHGLAKAGEALGRFLGGLRHFLELVRAPAGAVVEVQPRGNIGEVGGLDIVRKYSRVYQ